MALYDLNPRHDPDDTDPPDTGEEGDDGTDDGGDEGDASDADSPDDRAEPMRVVAVPVSVPHTTRVPVAAEISRDPRSRFRPMSDPNVAQVAILGSDGRRLLHLRPPFPEPIERMVAETYGPGKYRIVQRNDQGKHIGSRTVTVAGEPGKTITYATSGEAAPPAPSSNGHATPPGPPASPAAAFSAAPANAAPMDWRTALITTGIPLLAGVITAGFQAVSHRPEQKSELSTLTEVAKLLQVPNTERAEIFREGVKLYKTLAEEMPRPERSDGGGELNLREILQGIGEMVSAFRGQPPTAGAAVAAPGSPAPAPAPAQIAAATLSDEEAGQNYVEKLLLTEIRRAVGRADSPECLVVLIESYLPPMVVTWLESAPIESVLEELPKRFPKHTAYLQEEQVQAFLRSAITMLREDAAAAATEEGADVPSAGADATSS